MKTFDIEIKKLHDDATIPVYATAESAGCDLHAYLPDGDIVIPVGGRKLVKTGISLGLCRDTHSDGLAQAEVRPRSGLALKHGITVLNAPGTIDADYRGDVGVILYNAGDEDFTVSHGDRIAQLVFTLCRQASFRTVDELSETARGEAGFGSSGK